MNIDRPLDELVQESRNAKRAARLDRRKALRQTNKAGPPGVAAPANGDTRPADPDNKLAPSKRRLGIAKKRRARKAAAAATAAQAALDSDKNSPEPVTAPAPVSRRLAAPLRKAPRAPKGVKVAVSNLHPGVTQTDIAELFETVGPLRSAHLRTFANGHSACEAEVVFEAMPDALEAIKRYNEVPLDNQPLHITLATDSISTPSEPVHARVGKHRDRAPANGRKKHGPMDSADYEEEDPSPQRGNGFGSDRPSPPGDRPAGNVGPGQGRRQNRRRYRRYQNKPSGNGNGNANGGDRDVYVD